MSGVLIKPFGSPRWELTKLGIHGSLPGLPQACQQCKTKELDSWANRLPHLGVVQNQWHHFGIGAPPILEHILVVIGMFTGGTIRPMAIWDLAFEVFQACRRSAAAERRLRRSPSPWRCFAFWGWQGRAQGNGSAHPPTSWRDSHFVRAKAVESPRSCARRSPLGTLMPPWRFSAWRTCQEHVGLAWAFSAQLSR